MTMTESKRPRGRPRPPETIARDEAVLALLRTAADGLTRNEIADRLGEGKSKTWLSLDRLRRDNLVKLCAGTAGPDAVWTAEVGAPCP